MVDVMNQFKNEFINNLNKALVPFEYIITIDKWNPDKSVVIPTNNDCREMYLFFFWREMSPKTKDELYSAYKSICMGSFPKKLCVFFKEPSDDISASLAEFKASFSIRYGLFSWGFDNFDTLKIQFLLQLEDVLKRDGLNIMKTYDGKIVIGDSVFVNLNNVSFAYKNKEYSRLQSMVKDNQIKTSEKGSFDGQKIICNEFEQYQNYLLDMARVFARYISGAESAETRRAYRLFISGNAEEAERILYWADRKSDNERKQLCDKIECSWMSTKEQENVMNQLADIEFIDRQFMEAEFHSSDQFTIALLKIIERCSFRYENLITAIRRVFRRRYNEYADSRECLHYLNNQLLDLMSLFQKMEGEEKMTPEIKKYLAQIIDECS